MQEPEPQEVKRTFTKSGKSSHNFHPSENNKGLMMTSDRTIYARNQDTDVIRRIRPKVRGKKARKAEKLARRVACSNTAPSAVKTSTST